jgi:hypothetical protein
VQVSERLADGERELVGVELATEEQGEELRGGARLGEPRGALGQPCVVMIDERTQARGQPAEGQPVLLEHQRLGRDRLEAAE